MKIMKYLLFMFVLFAFQTGGRANGIWRHIEGLPCEETSCITQDSNGFLWFGTRMGLIRYDGYRHKIFRNDMLHPHAFGSCDIKCLAADKDGRVYAGAFYGLNTLLSEARRNEIVHFSEDDYVNAVYCDKGGRLWVGTYSGIHLRDGDGKFATVRDFPKDLVLDFCECGGSQMYVVTQNQGLWLVTDKGICQSVPQTQPLRPRCLAMSANGVLWMGTDGQGLYNIEKGIVSHREGYDGIVMNDVLVGNDGEKLYVATDQGVMSVALKPELTTNGAEWGLRGRNVKSLYADRNGNVWASTMSDGIYFLHKGHQRFDVLMRSFTKQTTPIISQFDVRHLADSLLWQEMFNINTVYEAADGTTYIGTWNDGLYVTRQGVVCRHINRNNTPWLKNNGIQCTTSLADGRILFASWEGLYLMPSSKFEGQAVERLGPSAVGDMHTLTMTRFGEDDLWLGVVGGIVHVKMKRGDLQHASVTLYTNVNQKGIRQPANLGTIANAQDEGEEYRLGGIFRILQDGYGRIWACTSEPGLLRYDEERDAFECVSGELGILGDNVHSLDIDRNGDFWMATNYGILRMGIDEKGRVKHRHLYTKQDHLPRNYYGSTMSCALADGSICFVSQDCLVTLNPSKQPDNRSKCNVLLSDLLVNGNPLVEDKTDMAIWAPQREAIVLNHDQNNISITLSALSYGEEASISYIYKLSGIDHDYLQTEMGSNSITYSQIPPGEYTLYYGLAGNEEADDAKLQTLSITVLQPLWWRWWARLLYVLIVVLVAYAFIHNLVDKNRKRHELEILAVEKHSLDEQYRKMMQFYVKVIHTFLTPATLMSEQISELQKKVRPSLQASLLILATQTRQLLDAMNEIIAVKKDDNSIREAMAKAQELTQTDSDFLRRCTDSVNRHLADTKYSHQVLMREVGASHATLYRKLKMLTGMDATSFIRSIRMKAACQILTQEPGIRINELADRVGYGNPKYFSTCFKAEFGMSPRDYQASYE